MLFKQVTAAARTLTLKNTYNSNVTKYININLNECEATPYEKIKTLKEELDKLQSESFNNINYSLVFTHKKNKVRFLL